MAEGAVPQLPLRFTPGKGDAPGGHTVPWQAWLRWYPRLLPAAAAAPANGAFTSLLLVEQWPRPTAKAEDGRGMKNA